MGKNRQREPEHEILHVPPSASEDGQAHDWDLRLLSRTDAEQHRTRLDGNQIEGIVQIQCGRYMIAEGVKKCRRIFRRMGLYRRFRQAHGLMNKAMDDFTEYHLCLEQIMVIHRALDNIGIHLTAKGEPTPDHCVCMDEEAVKTVCGAAAAQCALECKCMTGKQSKNCKLRRAFNMLPGFQERVLVGRSLMGDMSDVCPYYLATHLEQIGGVWDASGHSDPGAVQK